MTGECVGHPARGPEEMEVPAGGTGACGTALNPDFSSFTFTELVIQGWPSVLGMTGEAWNETPSV